MSRSHKFFHAVWSGYLLTVLISAQSLITYPIGLSALGKTGFGLWTAVAQVILFAGFLDLGMGPSLSRFLIDFKDDQANPEYGTFLKSVFAAGFLQAAAFCVAGMLLIPFLPDVMGIAHEQRSLFVSLLYWQIVPTALNFAMRPFGLLLYAHQQISRLNICSFVAILCSTTILILGLRSGFGIYTYVVAAWTTFLVLQASIAFQVWHLRLLPSMREAKISLAALKPLIAFSSNVFLIGLGSKLIEFVPALLVTRHLGVAALADWTIGTRLVYFISQLVSRISGSAEPVFWEMFKRNETDRLRERWVELTLLAGSFAAMLAGGMVAINPTFIQLWTSSRVSWRTTADLLLGIWVVLLAASVCLNMTPGITKLLGKMKWVFICEGIALMVIVYLPFLQLQSHWQVPFILILAASFFRLPYGWVRTSQDLKINTALLAKTFARIFGTALILIMIALAIRKLTTSFGLVQQMMINSAVYTIIGVVAVYFISLPAGARERIQGLQRRIFARNTILSKDPHKDVSIGQR